MGVSRAKYGRGGAILIP